MHASKREMKSTLQSEFNFVMYFIGIQCMYKEKKYNYLSSFYPEPCTRCVCDENWNGDLSNTKSCEPVNCKFDLVRQRVDEGCFPIYIEGGCCPYTMCPSEIKNIYPKVPSLKCYLPRSEDTNNQLSASKYSFNEENGICEKFEYFGSSFEENVFDTYEDCYGECVQNLNSPPMKCSWQGTEFKKGDTLVLETLYTNPCVGVKCLAPPYLTFFHRKCPEPPNDLNCRAIYGTGECCPTYKCEIMEETRGSVKTTFPMEEQYMELSTEEPSIEEPSAEEPSTEEPSTDEHSAEKPSTEEPSTEEPSTEEPSTEEPSTEEPSTEKPSTEELSTEELSTEEPSAEEPSTEESSAEQPSIENFEIEESSMKEKNESMMMDTTMKSADCDESKCKNTYFEHLKGRICFIFSENYYEDKNPGKCQYKGKLYNPGNIVKVDCNACYCSEYDGKASLICNPYDCGYPGFPNDECLTLTKPGDCCESDEAEQLKSASKCEYNGKKYEAGTSFYPEECMECFCDDKWTGELNNSKSCKPVDCKLDLLKQNLDTGCFPVYVEGKCCPGPMLCPHDILDISVATDLCMLPMNEGLKDSSFLPQERYFYNQESMKCEPFTFSGWGGNENSFKTMEECKSKCIDEYNICEIELDVGDCEEHVEKYFYNKTSNAYDQMCEWRSKMFKKGDLLKLKTRYSQPCVSVKCLAPPQLTFIYRSCPSKQPEGDCEEIYKSDSCCPVYTCKDENNF
ncbi:Serum response factor-binding protein 1 [Nymphon striatum]|nr:Serum response factor-binding protein 1 [Nymphon striatum]